jgi:ketosteroid isomerase-like protein
MSDQENLKAIEAHLKTIENQNAEEISRQCTEDVIWNAPVSRVVPYNHPGRGREAAVEYCKSLWAALEWEDFQVLKLLAAQDNHVVVLAKETFKVRSTGVRVKDNIFLCLMKLRDGLICQWDFTENTELLAAAFKGE